LDESRWRRKIIKAAPGGIVEKYVSINELAVLTVIS